jgi:hypothetical protein
VTASLLVEEAREPMAGRAATWWWEVRRGEEGKRQEWQVMKVAGCYTREYKLH